MTHHRPQRHGCKNMKLKLAMAHAIVPKPKNFKKLEMFFMKSGPRFLNNCSPALFFITVFLFFPGETSLNINKGNVNIL